MRHFALLSALMLTSAAFAGAQQTQAQEQGPTPTPEQIDTKAVDHDRNTKAIYGKIKNMTSGDKIVIDVDKGRNKTYNLGDPKMVVRVAEGLAVGDPVKVLESKVKGNRSVDIVRNVTEGTEQRSRTVDANTPAQQPSKDREHDQEQKDQQPQP